MNDPRECGGGGGKLTNSLNIGCECRVCGVEAAGRHYGSICCSGCKGFFRRSVRFQKLYRCPFAQQCAISKMYRNCCRACRFQKCLQVGLDPNLVQSDWGHSEGGGQKGDKGRMVKVPSMKVEEVKKEMMEEDEEEREEMLQMATNGIRAQMANGCEENGHLFCGATTSSSSSSQLIWHNRSLHAESIGQTALGHLGGHPSHGHGHDGLRQHFEALADYLVRVEHYCDLFTDQAAAANGGALSPLNCEFDTNVPLEMAFRQPGLITRRWPICWRTKELERGGPVFASLFCRLLVHTLDWASHLHELAELSDCDRKLLLKRRLMRALWWLVAHRSVPFHSGTQGMVVSGEMFYPRDPALQAKLDPDLRGMLADAVNMAYDQLIKPMRECQISEAENALLRAIAFFTPVARLSAEGRRQVLSIQNKYLNALTHLVMGREQRAKVEEGGKGGGKGVPEAMERMGRLLMLLTAVEQTAKVGDDTFAMFCTFNMNGMRGQLSYELHMGGGG